MKNNIYGYYRIPANQAADSIIDKLNQYGVSKIYCDIIGDRKKESPQLNLLLSKMKAGDTVVIDSFIHFAYSIQNLIELVTALYEIGITLIAIQETIDTSDPSGKMFYKYMQTLSQFVGETVSSRTKVASSAARARGRLGGRPKSDAKAIKQAIKLYNTGQYTLAEITDLTGITRSTIYRYIK